MKRFINYCLLITIVVCCCFVFRPKVNAKTSNEDISYLNSQVKTEIEIEKVIKSIEFELNKKSTDVITELMKFKKMTMTIDNNNGVKSENINRLIDCIDCVMYEYENYHEGRFIKGVFHSEYSPAIAAIAAGFISVGWNLSAELLLHARDNNVENSLYHPIYGSNICYTQLFEDISFDSTISGSDSFANYNLLDFSVYDEDAHFAINAFNYQKNYYNDSCINIIINDRYDYAEDTGNGLQSNLVNLCYNAQEAGVLVEYYVIIDIICDGYVPYRYSLNGTNLIIEEYLGASEIVTIPSLIEDHNTLYLPNAPLQFYIVKTISQEAFQGCTSLESITIPSTVTSIGSSAFKNCSSLENVTLLREQSPITSLGQNAFDNCASNLTITVPTNRVCEYKNTEYWSSYSSKIVPSSSISDHIDLDCMVDDDIITYLNAGYNKLYQLDVECSGTYTISCTGGTKFNIYNSNMVKIASAYYVVEITFSEGTYYIDTEWMNVNNSGNATLHFFNKGFEVSYNVSTDILSHLHQVDINDYRVRLKYNHENGPNYYSVTVNATSNNTINYYAGTITFYTDYNRQTVMNKLNNFYTLQAKSSDGASSMVMYFGSNGHYYFDVILKTNDLTSLTISINSLNTINYDLFELPESNNSYLPIMSSSIKGDYFKKAVLNQAGRFELTAEIDDNTIGDAYVLIARLIPLNNSYSLDVKLINIIDDNFSSTSKTCDLEPDTYYIGYFNNIEGKEISIEFERKITQYGSYNLISDPDMNEEYGSEVRFNNGLFLGTSLTVGFTRFIYLNYDYNLPSYSRLDYYFYSSNETIASISEYGTLLGKSAGSIKIMAVYKLDSSITFVKQFTVLTDNRLTDLIINNTDNCYYAESGQSYQVGLTDTNSFYPQNTLYNWNIVSSNNNHNYNISEWGTFNLNGSDIIVIEGVSKLNSKLKIRLTLTVI